MSWSQVFPVLTEEMVEEYERTAPENERNELAELFGVARWYNRRREPEHVVSTSLFWKNAKQGSSPLPVPTKELMVNALEKGLVERFAPWPHYVEPVLQAAAMLSMTNPEAVIRVYLAADLEFVIPELIAAGCEVALMRHSSISHNPGAMWRYLALEDRKLVTVIDADRALELEGDMARTVETSRVGLGFWRVPVWGEMNVIGKMAYRPIIGGQLGGCRKLRVRRLMEALVWHMRRGSIRTDCEPPGCGPQPIHGAVWPDYGFDEWFLLSSVYPRIAAAGVLSFVPARASSRLLPLDIEYVMWANSRSEMVYFGSAGFGCCGPDPNAPRLRRKSNGRVLLTGIWKLETANDVALISELCSHARNQDLPVEIRPVLHVLNEARLQELPPYLLDVAVLWRDLAYNTTVQSSLLQAVCAGHEADWIWQADCDERADFACAGGLRALIRKADREAVDYVKGEWIDRIGSGNMLPAIRSDVSLAKQFPRAILATTYWQGSLGQKIALHRRDCPTGIGNHEPVDVGKVGSSWSVPIWHFKWHSDCRDNLSRKATADAEAAWISEFERALARVETIDGHPCIRWDTLPPVAWPQLSAIHRRGHYPPEKNSPVRSGSTRRMAAPSSLEAIGNM